MEGSVGAVASVLTEVGVVPKVEGFGEVSEDVGEAASDPIGVVGGVRLASGSETKVFVSLSSYWRFGV